MGAIIPSQDHHSQLKSKALLYFKTKNTKLIASSLKTTYSLLHKKILYKEKISKMVTQVCTLNKHVIIEQ